MKRPVATHSNGIYGACHLRNDAEEERIDDVGRPVWCGLSEYQAVSLFVICPMS